MKGHRSAHFDLLHVRLTRRRRRLAWGRRVARDLAPRCPGRGFATKREAQAELTRILTSVEGGIYVAPQRMSVADFLQTTWLPTVEHTIKPGTFESYRRNVRLHIAGGRWDGGCCRTSAPRTSTLGTATSWQATISTASSAHGLSPTSPRSCTGRSATPFAGRPSRATPRTPPTLPAPGPRLRCEPGPPRNRAPSSTPRLATASLAAGGCSPPQACAEVWRSDCDGPTSTSNVSSYVSVEP